MREWIDCRSEVKDRDCSEEKKYYSALWCVAANCRNVVDLSKCIFVHNIPSFGD